MKNKQTKKEYMAYEDYLKRAEHIQSLEQQGVILLHKKNKVKFALGCVCLGIAIFPNGLGIIFYPLGFMLMGWSMTDLNKFRKRAFKELRSLIRRLKQNV